MSTPDPIPPNPQTLMRFARGEAAPGEGREVVRWLLLDGALGSRPDAAAPSPEDYDSVLEQVFARARTLRAPIDAEAERARAALARIEALGTEQLAASLDTLAASQDVRSLEASKQLSAAAAGQVAAHPQRAALLARLAIAAAQGADTSTPQDLARDCEAEAEAQLGNALRVAGDLPAADQALERARTLLADGTGDLALRARVQNLRGVLRANQRRLDEALASYRSARRAARRVGDDAQVGRILLNEATAHAYRGAGGDAIRTLERALERVDPSADPRLALVIRHNYLSYLETEGRSEEAWQGLADVRRLAAEAGGPLDRLRLRWLEGRIAARRGELGQAAICLGDARDALLAQGIGYDTALVTLELAAVYLQQGATAEVKRLASSLVPVFRAQDVHREAQAALRVFCQAAEAEQAGLALVDDLRSYLERARSRPDLPFRRP